MSSKIIRTVQGQMWDQIALDRLNVEHDMRDVVDLNVSYADALILSGELNLSIPETPKQDPVRTLPPWER